MKYHNGEIFIVDAVVVDWGFEEMRVLLEPGVVISLESETDAMVRQSCVPLGQVDGRSEHVGDGHSDVSEL